jgi:hypothetical protein
LLARKTRGDVLVWKWMRGEATTMDDFGDPRQATGYALCMYDGRPSLIAEATIPAGGICGAKPCWRETSLGFRYRDAAVGSAGILSVDLRSGASGTARIVVRGRGSDLDIPRLPVKRLPVVVQLVTGDGECWEATYESQIETNRTRRFSARAEGELTE